MKSKLYLITGITSQLGKALTRELIKDEANYIVGIVREEKFFEVKEFYKCCKNIIIMMAKKGESGLIKTVLSLYEPDVIINLAAKTSVAGSNDAPEEYMYVNVEQTYSILNAIRQVISPTYNPLFINASSIEIFGNCNGALFEARSENTPIAPTNIYGLSKASAHIAVDTYRQVYGIRAVNLILSNFISEFQDSKFVIGKVLNYLFSSMSEKLTLGNVDSIRDWSYVDDIVGAIQTIVLNGASTNYCIASGNKMTVREIIELFFSSAEIDNPYDYITIEKKLFRVGDTNFSNIDCSKIRSIGWVPKYTIKDMVTKILYEKKKTVEKGIK